MADATLKMLLLGEDRGASKVLKNTGDAADKTESKFSRLTHVAGKALAAGFLAGGAAMIKFGQQASDLSETQSKVNQIFGKDSAAALDKFASSAAKTMGQSKQMALDGAATFGMFGKAAGKTGDDLVEFSTKMSTLASDMASFSNTSPEQAIEALSAALRGESEPIRAYGVMLDDATLKAEALSMGILKPVKDSSKINLAYANLTNSQIKYNKAVKEHGKTSIEAVTAQAHLGAAQSALKKATDGTIPTLTMQQKALAAQSSIMKQTKDQQGDFARTSGGLANKQRILKAEFENMTTQLGTKALPVMLKVTDWAVKAIEWMTKHQKLVKGIVAVIGPLVAGLYLLAKAQMAVNLAMEANPIGLVIVAIAALAAGLAYAWTHSTKFRTIMIGTFNAIGSTVWHMWDSVIRPVFRFIVSAWLTVAGALINGAARAFGWVPGLGPKLRKAAAWFNAFRDDVNRQLDGIHDAKVKVSAPGATQTISQLATLNNLLNAIKHKGPKMNIVTPGMYNPNRAHATGTSNFSGGATWVGERGRELVTLPRGSRIDTADRLRGMASAASDPGYVVVVVQNEDGRVLEQKLAKVKRDKGGVPLAFERAR